jgi:hypothetical protein
MKQITQPLTRSLLHTAIGLVLCVQLLPTSIAADNAHHGTAQQSEPARWTQQDTSSSRDYLATLKKEAAAAYRINMSECKTMKGKARSNCEKEAREIHKQDLKDAELKAKEM